jgi:riboflavin synthase
VFTGIVRERGRVVAAEPNGDGLRLRVEAPETASAAAPGDSVAVSGCCLTVTAVTNGSLAFDAVPETIARTNLGRLAAGAEVNIEPALRAGGSIPKVTARVWRSRSRLASCATASRRAPWPSTASR